LLVYLNSLIVLFFYLPENNPKNVFIVLKVVHCALLFSSTLVDKATAFLWTV